jgi:hypothetical protein
MNTFPTILAAAKYKIVADFGKLADNLAYIYGFRESQSQEIWKAGAFNYIKNINDITIKPSYKKLKYKDYYEFLYDYEWEGRTVEDMKNYYFNHNRIYNFDLKKYDGEREILTIKSDEEYKKFLVNAKAFGKDMAQIMCDTPPNELSKEVVYQKIDQYFLS